MKHIAILDFGSQYTHLIAKRIREMNVLAKIYPSDTSAEKLKNNIFGIIISGGPQSINNKNSIKADSKIFNLGLPILGLCYGHQFIAHSLGGSVKPSNSREYGKSKLKLQNKSLILDGIKNNSIVWMSHGDSVAILPKDFECIGSTKDCEITAMSNENKKIYGLQFHPEVRHSEEGMKILENFIFKICKSEKNWKVKDVIKNLIKKIQKQANNKKIFILVSGGVDSSVAFALLTKALGESRVKGLYINNGFMRKDESNEITTNFEKAGFHNLETIDASKLFFNHLENIYDPEEKRKIIGQSFLDAKDMAAKNLKLESDNWILGQGTIYPDIIETGGSKNADTIKTHHNRIDSIQKLIKKGLIIEPLVDFYKDEVRQIGKLLGLSNELINRHPFPGPGLAIRCLCHDNSNNINISENKKINKILNGNNEKINFEIIPIKSVGIQGDNRTYAHPLAISGILDWNKLDTLSSKITNNIKCINRVLLLLNPENKKSFSAPINNLFLSKERIKLLQEIDNIVMKTIKENKLYSKIWQFPVVLIPITNNNNKESIVLRPIVSLDAMTADFYKMNKKILKLLTKKILNTKKISHIFYDITHKPPGTIEWE
jgi:GMP synthase (glutamine-hydrolysing)